MAVRPLSWRLRFNQSSTADFLLSAACWREHIYSYSLLL
jgi:hypothetical protein